MASSKVIRSIFFTTDELFWMEQLTIRSSPNLVDHSRFQIQENCSRNMFPCTSFTKESVEGIISSTHSFVTRHLSIRLHKNPILMNNIEELNLNI
ncbi:hypothetical protein ACHQM5_006194 [Ranunculus cassubicifolius]